MTRQYLAGELSVRLEHLQAVTSANGAAQVARLRRQVESCPPAWLAAAMRRALALADGLCWESLSSGDTASFTRQASASAELRQFGICSRLIGDDLFQCRRPDDGPGSCDGQPR